MFRTGTQTEKRFGVLAGAVSFVTGKSVSLIYPLQGNHLFVPPGFGKDRCRGNG
jgi:hypothetical protein